MLKKLIELLTTKFGVGAKVVEGIAEKLSKTVTTEEEAATAVEGVSFQQVLESYADKRANEASETARKNAIKSYEDKYGLKDGEKLKKDEPAEPIVPTEPQPKKEPEPKNEPEPKAPESKPKEDDEVPPYVKAILAKMDAQSETIKSLQGELAGIKTAKLKDDRHSVLMKEIEKLSEAQRKPYARIALDSMSDDEFNAFIEETRADVATIEKDNAAATAAAAAGRPFIGNVMTNGKAASKAELDEVASKIIK